MCKKSNKKKSKKTNENIDVNSDEDLEVISDQDYLVLSEEELYSIRKSNYSEKTTADLKKIRNILKGKKYRFEVNSTHSNKIFAFLAIFATIITIMFSCLKNENGFVIGGLLFLLAFFASVCLWAFHNENKDSDKYQNMKEECIVRIGIINDILEEREKAESANENNNVDAKEHINTKQ